MTGIQPFLATAKVVTMDRGKIGLMSDWSFERGINEKAPAEAGAFC
jgi:hypothetical protein